jgi:hypothetical protein
MEKTLVKEDGRSASVCFCTWLGWAYDNLCGLEGVWFDLVGVGAIGSTSTEGGRGVAVLVRVGGRACAVLQP